MENTDNKSVNPRDPYHRAGQQLTLEDLRKIVDESRQSGVSNKTFEEIIADGDRIAKERGIFRP